MAAYEYDDFWVEFSPRAGGGYSVAARAPDGATSKGSFQLPFTNEQLEAAVRTLGYTRAATTRDIGEVTTERRLTAEQLGSELADSLLIGPTGDLYNQARSAAIAKNRGVRLWLSLGKAPGLLSVPWEFLYLQPTFLASQRKTPIVRFLSTHAPVAPRRIEDTVRILGVVASPDGLPKLEVAQERKRVDDALGKARQDREVTIDWLDPATPKALRLALQKGEYHILHFVGHSGYVAENDATHGGGGGGVLFLENEDHSPAQVSDAQLVNLLGDQESLRLAVLNSCEGARTSAVDPFAGIATSIVALGIPAVVAMQFEISDKAAITFAEELYQSLIARQDPIDVAVAEARKAVFTEVNETEWATPVLFLRNEDGRLFDFAPVVASAGAAGATAAATASPPPVDDGIAATTATAGAAATLGRTAGDGATTGTPAGPAATTGSAATGAPTGGSATAATATPAVEAGTGSAPPATPAADPPPTGAATLWNSPTGPRPMAQPQVKRTSPASRPWAIGAIVVIVVVLLLGGMSAAGLFGPVEESPGPSDSPEAADSAGPAVSVGPAASDGSADTTTLGYPVVPGTKDEWVGPRPKSNKLAVAGGASSSVTNVSTLQVPDSGGGQSVGASVATDLPGVFDFDPVWDPERNVIAFSRFQNGSSQIKYVVPGIGQRPDGVADQGISVKDPVLKTAAAGTRDHAPAWRGDGNLLFSRTRACRPGPGCVEDIVLATFTKRIGDYIVPIDHPAVVGDEWSEIRKISVDPTNDERILVTGRHMKSPGKEFGVWVVDLGGDRALLPGSGKATYAIVGTNDAVVAIERGNQDGWGPALLGWPRGRTGQPDRIPADDIIAKMPDGSGSEVPIEFAGIAASPLGDARYAVFAAARDADKSRTVPQIVILGGDGMPLGYFAPQPPQGVDWNTLIALGW